MRYSIIVMTFLLFASCTEETITRDTTGTLEGRVSEAGTYTFAGVENVQVSVEGTNPLQTVSTDKSGRFSVSGLATGTYNLIFSKPGYGTEINYGFTFIGAANPVRAEAYLYQLPHGISIQDISLEINRWYENKITINGTAKINFPPAVRPQLAYLRFYFGRTADVSPTVYDYSSVSYDFASEEHPPYISMTLPGTKFKPGTTVYMKVLVCSNRYSGYTDPETGNFIYSSVSPETVFTKSFNLPL